VLPRLLARSRANHHQITVTLPDEIGPDSSHKTPALFARFAALEYVKDRHRAIKRQRRLHLKYNVMLVLLR